MGRVSFRIGCLVTALCAFVLFHAQALAQSPVVTASPMLTSFPQPSAWPLISNASGTRETLGPGVNYVRWSLATNAGPLQLSVAVVDLQNPDVSLQVATHGNAIAGAGERFDERGGSPGC